MRIVLKQFSQERLVPYAALLLFVTSISLTGLSAKPAAAATGCGENDRNFAESLASSGNFVEPVSVPLNDNGKITLRYSSDSGCAWGLVSNLDGLASTGARFGYVWIDRSWNSGADWQGKLGETATNTPNNSAYTGTFNASGGYNSVRACGRTMLNVEPAWDPYGGGPWFGPIACTAWFFPGWLGPGQSIGGQGFNALTSSNNRYVLRMQNDGNLVLYSWGNAVWATGTNTPGSILKLQPDGNLVVIAPGNHARWSTGTYNYPGSLLMLQNDGNIVLVSPGGHVRWASGTNGR